MDTFEGVVWLVRVIFKGENDTLHDYLETFFHKEAARVFQELKFKDELVYRVEIYNCILHDIREKTKF